MAMLKYTIAMTGNRGEIMSSMITLPYIRATKTGTEKKQPCLIVTGGRAPEPHWLQQVAKEKVLWAADHGIDACRRAELLPDRLIGDLDSLSLPSLAWAEAKDIPIEKFPTEKDETDTQLALRKAEEAGYGLICLAGAFGNRTDHAMSTLYTAAAAGTDVILADDREALFFLQGGQALELAFDRVPKALSLLPLFGDAEGVTMTGVHWPLLGAHLAERRPTAVSNRLEEGATRCNVSLTKGLLGVYICLFE